jgi:hypothetical protein
MFLLAYAPGCLLFWLLVLAANLAAGVCVCVIQPCRAESMLCSRGDTV